MRCFPSMEVGAPDVVTLLAPAGGDVRRCGARSGVPKEALARENATAKPPGASMRGFIERQVGVFWPRGLSLRGHGSDCAALTCPVICRPFNADLVPRPTPHPDAGAADDHAEHVLQQLAHDCVP